jgi:hypothetical protein
MLDRNKLEFDLKTIALLKENCSQMHARKANSQTNSLDMINRKCD